MALLFVMMMMMMMMMVMMMTIQLRFSVILHYICGIITFVVNPLLNLRTF